MITITQALFSSLTRSVEFVKELPDDCQITVILAIQTLDSFFNELAIINQFIESENITPEVVALTDILSELEKSNGSLKLKFLNANYILNGNGNIKGTKLYEELNLLISLRNKIVHPKPTVLSETNKIENDKLFKTFQAMKLIDSYDADNPIKRSVKYYLMNLNIALWAVSTVKKTIEYFIDSLPNEESKLALSILKISLMDQIELKQYSKENE